MCSFPNWRSRPLSESFNGELGQREYLTLAGKGQRPGPGRKREEKKNYISVSRQTGNWRDLLVTDKSEEGSF